MTTQIQDKTVKKPGGTGYEKWNVVLWNDDHNSMDGVMLALMRIIGHNAQTARDLMSTAHTMGSAIVYTGHKEHSEMYREQLEAAGLTATIEKA